MSARGPERQAVGLRLLEGRGSQERKGAKRQLRRLRYECDQGQGR